MTDYITLFKNWFSLKVRLWNAEKDNLIFKQGEVWWCSLGYNIGEEIFGKGEKFTRPILIFRKFTHNSFLGLPLTSKNKEGSWYVQISLQAKISSVILNQARILDKKRLNNRIGTLDDKDFKRVKEEFLKLYGS